MKIQIVTLNPDEWEKYRDLRLVALRQSPQAWGQTLETTLSYPAEKWRQRIEETITEKGNKIYFAKAGNRIAGVIGIRPDASPKSPHVAHIFSFFVKKEFQGKGIGTLLMEKALAECRNSISYKKARLKVMQTQLKAISLYKKFGFIIAGVLKKEVLSRGRYYDQYIMEKYFD